MLTSFGMAKKYSDEFYEKTRFIMLKNEIQIYKHLPDQESREAFIKDFWEKRDPSPGTVENENKIEYERRLAYVERWFKEKTRKSRGWDSDRGRIYLLLGGPDERSTRQGTIIDNSGSPVAVLAEIWFYEYYRLYLEFVDENSMGRYRLRHWPTQFISAVERAKFTINEQDKKQMESPFKFKAKFKKNKIKIQIPTKTVSFLHDKEEDKMMAAFKITAYIYHNYKKIGKIATFRDISDSKDTLSKQKNITLTIPYTPPSKGKYHFDIIVQDEGPTSSPKYRDIIQYKL